MWSPVMPSPSLWPTICQPRRTNQIIVNKNNQNKSIIRQITARSSQQLAIHITFLANFLSFRGHRQPKLIEIQTSPITHACFYLSTFQLLFGTCGFSTVLRWASYIYSIWNNYWSENLPFQTDKSNNLNRQQCLNACSDMSNVSNDNRVTRVDVQRTRSLDRKLTFKLNRKQKYIMSRFETSDKFESVEWNGNCVLLIEWKKSWETIV